jgi:hypothetical protein
LAAFVTRGVVAMGWRWRKRVCLLKMPIVLTALMVRLIARTLRCVFQQGQAWRRGRTDLLSLPAAVKTSSAGVERKELIVPPARQMPVEPRRAR